MEREVMEFDVVIVGAGPAGLAAACKLAQLSHNMQQEINICVVEKGADVGAHILSGALLETTALDELFPDWQAMGAPVNTHVTDDQLLYLTSANNHIALPELLTPKPMHNTHDNYVISLANLCRWLAQQAEALGVAIFPGFPAANIKYDDHGHVTGVITQDMGLDKQGQPKDNFEPGIELKAKYTLFSEGARGHLGKQLIKRFELNKGKQPQHYALGIKEIWQLPEAHPKFQQGLALHTAGWPLSETNSTGGGFVYHSENNQIVVGLITDLNYQNPYLSPFDEFQRYKHHPAIRPFLEGGERIAYGARAIAKGGLHALPKQQFPGGVLIGCDAGTLNAAKIKGTHTAMKSGMLAAEAVFAELTAGNALTEPDYQSLFQASWLYQELLEGRNFSAAQHRFGSVLGGMLSTFEHNIWMKLTGKIAPWHLDDPCPDYVNLKHASQCHPITYQKPDGKISFDKSSSLYLSGTQHEENQPCHLVLSSQSIPINNHLVMFEEPAQRYCPAGVYEIVSVEGANKLQINAANCLHCKTCDIKDPSQNITWRTPEGGGGPGYGNM
ncbi:4Fe-4S dicluster domain-containing protein [Vibrio sp. TRT 17S01]|uniref:electron transfer flavoprotein-ubiquinone oxidoreductase n=1 Tax=Vibrio sp. TRT 17S01 TaxID=3418505 RepID=UPI003CF80829